MYPHWEVLKGNIKIQTICPECYSICQVEVKLFSLSHMGGVQWWHCHPVSLHCIRTPCICICMDSRLNILSTWAIWEARGGGIIVTQCLFCRATLVLQRARESAKTTISPRYPQETINAAPGNAQNSPDCAENNWTKWGNTLEKRQGGVTEKTRIYGPPWIAQTLIQSSICNQFPPTNKLIAPPPSCSTLLCCKQARQKATQGW